MTARVGGLGTHRTTRPGVRRGLRHRGLALWAGLTVTLVLVGAAGLASGSAGAAGAKKDDTAIAVHQVDATGDQVVARGTILNGDPAGITATVDGKKVDSTTVGADRVPLDAVVVLDNSVALGNATVQLSKEALAPLLPGAGVVSRMALVTTGGGASVETGLTTSAAQVANALDGVDPSGQSATWDGLVDAANLLDDDRSDDRDKVVVLFTAAPNGISSATPARAETAMRQAGAQLDAVYMQRGADVEPVVEMVATLGGSSLEVGSEEDLDTGFQQVADQLAGRFQTTFSPPAGNAKTQELTLASGKAATTVEYAPGAVRTGAVNLAPAQPEDGGFLDGLTSSSWFIWLIVLLGVAAVVLAVWTLLTMVLPDDDNLVRRLKHYEDPYGENAEGDEAPETGVTVPILKRAVDFTGDMAERRGILEKLEADLERANLPLRAAEALFFAGVGGVLLGVLVLAMTRSLIMALVAMLVAVFLPRALLSFRIHKRQKAFVGQLPDMLSLMAGTLRAGYSIGQGFEAVSREIDDPMGRELRRVVTENRLGRPLDEALDSVADRMESDDFAWAVMAIRIQREVGGNLAELLLTVADTMTQRERLRRDVATLTAEGRVSAVVLGLLPPGLGVVMWVMNPEYISALFSPGLGYTLLGLAGVSMLIGFAWMKKIITIEV